MELSATLTTPTKIDLTTDGQAVRHVKMAETLYEFDAKILRKL